MVGYKLGFSSVTPSMCSIYSSPLDTGIPHIFVIVVCIQVETMAVGQSILIHVERAAYLPR